MRTVMQTGYSATDEAAQIIAMHPQRTAKQEFSQFSDNNDHLQALENEAKLLITVAALRTGMAPDDDFDEQREPRFPFLPEGAGLQQAVELLRAAADENRCREELTRRSGARLNFVEYCDSMELDLVERQIVMLLLMQFSSPSFCSAYRISRLERCPDNGIKIGPLLTIISENLGQQLENRRYFSIHGRLMNQDNR